jgi:hypothetical protein
MKRHDYSDSAFSLFGFESGANCADYIARSESMTFSEAHIQDGAGGQINKSVRNNDRVIFEDSTLADKVWAKLAHQEFNVEAGWKAIGLNNRFSFYRYRQFQQFSWHRDQPYRPSVDVQSKVTFILYLNDEFSGGQTSFDDFNVWPETGMAVCFHHKLRHCGSVVTDGIKYVMRSDIMFKHEG